MLKDFKEFALRGNMLDLALLATHTAVTALKFKIGAHIDAGEIEAANG